jgi:hypothetical protein
VAGQIAVSQAVGAVADRIRRIRSQREPGAQVARLGWLVVIVSVNRAVVVVVVNRAVPIAEHRRPGDDRRGAGVVAVAVRGQVRVQEQVGVRQELEADHPQERRQGGGGAAPVGALGARAGQPGLRQSAASRPASVTPASGTTPASGASGSHSGVDASMSCWAGRLRTRSLPGMMIWASRR